MRVLTRLVAAVLTATAVIAQAPTCTFTAFGRPCGGVLAGTQLTSPTTVGVRFDVTGAAPGAIAVLALGHRDRGSVLPGSTCLLLIDPRATYFAQVDRAGAVSFRFPLPAVTPFQVDAQVVTVGLSRNGRTAESTNALNVLCR